MLLPMLPQSGSRLAPSCPSPLSSSTASATAPLALSSTVGGAAARGGCRDKENFSFPGGVFAASTKGRSGGGGASASREPPETTSSQSAVSRTERLTQPSTARPCQPSRFGARETRPRLTLSPKRPLQAAGMRIEPAPSPAEAIGTRPAATAEPEPPLEPPGVCCGFQGLRVTP